MNFTFFTNISFEDWDYDSSVKKGIGGSETSIVEMSWRLAKRGHNVTVYAPIKKTTKTDWRGTKWRHFKEATFKEPGVWILYRCPNIVMKFPKNHPQQQIWFLMQDWDYPDWEKYIKRTDKIITLCQEHGKFTLNNHPSIGDKLWLSSNGIKVDLIEKIEQEKITRNPLRIMYASSPDRGLEQAMRIFRKAREYIPELELHAFYGFNNIDKLVKSAPNHPWTQNVIRMKKMIEATEGLTFHGRVSQPDLYREWFKSGIYLYITDFFETSNIASQEAQAMGAVPIFSPVYAQGENIKYGIAVEGQSSEPLTIARAAVEVVRLAQQPELQEKIRPEMMTWARKRFDWNNFAIQWELEAQNKRKEFESEYAFPVQLPLVKKKSPYYKFEDYTKQFLKNNIKNASVLDVGGYDGRQAKWCMDNEAATAIVVDNGSWKIYDDWKKFTQFENVKYITKDFMSYDKKADVVIFQNVIYHLRNPWAALERIRNLTKKLLIISSSYVTGSDQSWRVYRPREGHPISWTVAWRPTESGLRALLEATGFKIIDEAKDNMHIILKCIPVKPPIGFKYEQLSD